MSCGSCLFVVVLCMYLLSLSSLSRLSPWRGFLHRRTWTRLLWNIVAAISIVSFFRIFCCVFHGFAPSFLSIQYLRYRWPVQCRFYLEPILDRLAPGYLVLIPLRSVSWLDKQCLKHCIHIQKKICLYSPFRTLKTNKLVTYNIYHYLNVLFQFKLGGRPSFLTVAPTDQCENDIAGHPRSVGSSQIGYPQIWHLIYHLTAKNWSKYLIPRPTSIHFSNHHLLWICGFDS